MADRPLIFSAPMVRALLDGRKSMTRRVLTPQPGPGMLAVQLPGEENKREWIVRSTMDRFISREKVPYAVGDRLWCREGFYQFGHWEPAAGEVTRKRKRQKWRFVTDKPDVLFDAPAGYRKGRHAADPGTPAWHLRQARFMPRIFSRLTLLVTGVKVERLQEISEEDAKAEGISPVHDRMPTTRPSGIGPAYGIYECRLPDGKLHFDDSAYRLFEKLWNSINGPGAWEANPFVVAITFKTVKANIDHLPAEAA